MFDFKKLVQKGFWSEKWQPVKEKLRPYLGPALRRARVFKAKAKTKIYPFVKPALLRYRAFRAKHPVTARVTLFSVATAFVGFFSLAFFIGMVYWGAFGELPTEADLRNIDQNLASEVYSADSVLLGKYFFENRLPSDIADISPYIINGLVATEDARFFEHGGVDMRAWLRVFFRTIMMRDQSGGGGSTLSQQLAKNLFPRKNHGLLTIPVAKLKEIFIAERLEGIYDKNQLLGLYLNKVSFGGNVFGIRMAAKRFFDTTPKEIKVEEAAVLVGMLKATSGYNPRRNPERSKMRRNIVLSQMVKYGKLDTLTFDSLRQLPIELKYHSESHDEGLATYFREHLRLDVEEELKKHRKPDGSPYNLYTDGLKIYTTIDSRLQRHAEQAVNEQMAKVQKKFIWHFRKRKKVRDDLLEQSKKASARYRKLKKRGLSPTEIDSLFRDTVRMTIFTWENEQFEKDTLMTPLDSIKHYLTLLRTGFLAAEPQTGKILAWVGGINFKYFKYDHIESKRQVGSTFKPFVYAAALEKGIPPCERLDNELVKYANDYEPKNADGQYGGNYSMKGALTKSVNVVAVAMLKRVGIGRVKELAKAAGITSHIPSELGIALGSADISLFEMVQAFSIFPNRGLKADLHYITRIETADGETVVEFPEPKRKEQPRILKEKNADIMNTFLRSVVDSGTARRLRYINNFYYPVAGKTGTTNNNTDGWFIGYTPTLITGAWVGASQPAVHWYSTRYGQGAATALPICGHFLSKVYKDPDFKSYRRKVFAPLDTLNLAALRCPDFIHPDSLIADSIRMAMKEQELKQSDLIRIIKDAFHVGNSDQDRKPSKARPRNDGSEKVRKKNEKLEKRRRRKENRKKKIREIKEKINGGG
ncbi:MAG TPA: penicillin-binding protein [Bacteroidetes bacterium]|nr:penicillin-binding protein [Bacteroidota bacterium]